MIQTTLAQLQASSTIVVDSGNVATIARLQPQDATTNPSLLLASAQDKSYQAHVAQATSACAISDLYLDLSIAVGCDILSIIPGRVSIEVDASLSFDVDATVARAHEIVNAFVKKGINEKRLLIKIAATWEGVRAAERLEKEGIGCNLTLLFSLTQAIACADAGVTLISPFVGRITDWYKKHEGVDNYAIENDPGVQSVKSIYAYYKKHGHATEIMAASFRSTEQIVALAGCDLLTIAPALLDALAQSHAPISQALDHQFAERQDVEKQSLDEQRFRWQLNENAMATEKLAEGIRIFDCAMQQLGRSAQG